MAKESTSSGGGREHTHEHATARYEHPHQPTQLVSGVGLGDSGRGKEEAPLVTDDVAMDEDEDDDGVAEQYVYTGASSGFEHHESVPELPSQHIMDDLPVVKKFRKRARKGKKAVSMIQPPQQPRLQDRIDIPDADKWHIPVNQSYLQ